MNIREVAKKANVSTATVSRVLNGIPTVNKELRERVTRVIEEENYVRSAVARSMNLGKTFILGLVLPDITNPFFPDIARGVEDAASAAGYKVILCNTDNLSQTQTSYLRMLREQRVEGVILVSAGEGDVDEVQSLIPDVPIVWCDRLPESGSARAVATNHQLGIRLAVEHLHDLGHREIAMIAGPALTSSLERTQLFVEEMQRMGTSVLPNRIVQGDYGYQSGFQAMQQLLLQKDVTAVFCANDLMAFGAMEAVFQAGLDVPNDISIVGYDNIPFSNWSRPALTTVSQPTYLLGMSSLEILVQSIEGNGSVQGTKLLDPSLVIRKSTSRVRT